MDSELRSLRVAGAFGGFAQSLAGVVGTLLASRAGHTEWAAGLPQTLLVLGSAGAAALLTRMMSRRGRGPALGRAATVAATGCLLGVGAAASDDLVALCVASVLIGWGTCAVMFSRYAAVDGIADSGETAQRLGQVLAAVAVGAVLGPNLLVVTSWSETSTGLPFGVAAYGASACAFGIAAVVWRRGLPNVPVDAPRIEPITRRFNGAAVAALGAANLVMVAAMTMAPVQMHDHNQDGLGMIGLVVSAHIAAMFAPAPVTGRLVDALGESSGLLLGGGIYVIATALAVAASGSSWLFASAMVLLGAAWNITTVSASSALTRTADGAERLRREGIGEIGMGAAAGVGGLSSGLLMSAAGYPALAASALVVTVVCLLPLSRALGSSATQNSLV